MKIALAAVAVLTSVSVVSAECAYPLDECWALSSGMECWQPTPGGKYAADFTRPLIIKGNEIVFFDYFACDATSAARSGQTRIYDVECWMEGEESGPEKTRISLTPHGYGYTYLQFDNQAPELWRQCRGS